MNAVVDLLNLEETRDALLQSDVQTALEKCAAFLGDNPDHPYGVHLLALVSFAMGDKQKAMNLLEKLHEMNPDSRETADSLAVVLARSGNMNESLFYAKLATALEPDETLESLIPDVFRNYAIALQTVDSQQLHISPLLEYSKGNYANCIRLCQDKIKTNSYDWEIYVLMAKALKKLHIFDDALTSLHTALAGSNVKHPEWQLEVADNWAALGRIRDAFICYVQCSEDFKGNEDEMNYLSRILAALQKIGMKDTPQSQAILQRLKNLVFKDNEEAILLGGGEDLEDRKIRIAYLSNSFHNCDKGEQILNLIAKHDKSRFEIFCYNNNDFEDKTTIKIKSLCDDWRDIHDLDDLTAAYLITCDSVDILVDCIGIDDNQRLGILAQKPAPVLYSWLNQLSGHEIGIAVQDLSFESIGENVLSYDPESIRFKIDYARKEREETETSIVFSCHSDLTSLSLETVMAWCTLLKTNAKANLLVGGPGCNQRAVRARFSEIFMNHGLGNRVFFQNLSGQDAELSAFLNLSDVYLCSSPWSEPKIAAAALATGTPVVAFESSAATNYNALEVLKAAKKEEWVVKTSQDYCQKAIKLGEAALKSRKEDLAQDLSDKAIFDSAKLTKAVEDKCLRDLGIS